MTTPIPSPPSPDGDRGLVSDELADMAADVFWRTRTLSEGQLEPALLAALYAAAPSIVAAERADLIRRITAERQAWEASRGHGPFTAGMAHAARVAGGRTLSDPPLEGR